jgi:hypothetical protein
VQKSRRWSQGLLILPADWREAEIGESREVYVIKRKGYLKIVPKRRVDLPENFDRVDLGVEAIGSWKRFEKKFYEANCVVAAHFSLRRKSPMSRMFSTARPALFPSKSRSILPKPRHSPYAFRTNT